MIARPFRNYYPFDLNDSFERRTLLECCLYSVKEVKKALVEKMNFCINSEDIHMLQSLLPEETRFSEFELALNEVKLEIGLATDSIPWASREEEYYDFDKPAVKRDNFLKYFNWFAANYFRWHTPYKWFTNPPLNPHYGTIEEAYYYSEYPDQNGKKRRLIDFVKEEPLKFEELLIFEYGMYFSPDGLKYLLQESIPDLELSERALLMNKLKLEYHLKMMVWYP